MLYKVHYAADLGRRKLGKQDLLLDKLESG
jgi:hypothetical protein